MRSITLINILLLLFICRFCYSYTLSLTTSISIQKQYIDNDSYNVADVFYQKGNYAKAIKEFSKSLEKTNLNHINATKKIAFSYAALNKSKEACFYIELYLKKEFNTHIFTNKEFDTIKNTPEFNKLNNKYTLNISLWTLFYLYTGLVGIFIAFVINLKKSSNKIANALISFFILLHSFFIIHVSLHITNLIYILPGTLRTTATFSYLYGPLLYFYFKRNSENYIFKKSDFLHLIPFIILLIYLIPTYSLSSEDKLIRLLNKDQTHYAELVTIVITKIMSLSIYGYLIFNTFKKNILKYSLKGIVNHESLKWQKSIVIFNTVYIISYIIYALIITKIIHNNHLIHPQVISMSLLVLYVGYSAYVRPDIFTTSVLSSEKLNAKYKNSGMTQSYSEELKQDLERLFNEEKVYKENNITLDILASKIGTTRHNTSQIINEHFKINFFEMVNKFRIQEAKEILKNDSYKNLSIINIAYEIGYNNKVTFNKAFKKETGFTPTQYIVNINSQKNVKTA